MAIEDLTLKVFSIKTLFGIQQSSSMSEVVKAKWANVWKLLSYIVSKTFLRSIYQEQNKNLKKWSSKLWHINLSRRQSIPSWMIYGAREPPWRRNLLLLALFVHLSIWSILKLIKVSVTIKGKKRPYGPKFMVSKSTKSDRFCSHTLFHNR